MRLRTSQFCKESRLLIICQIHIRPEIKEEEGEQVQKDATRIKQRSLSSRNLIVIFGLENFDGKVASVSCL